MTRHVRSFFDVLEDRVRGFLSHYPIAYAFVAGTGVILFWRGVWHGTDTLHLLFEQYRQASTIDLSLVPWWDAPLSLFAGAALLLLSGTFVSSFIGNEIIISGLRGEKKLTERTQDAVKHEAGAIAGLQEELAAISRKLDDLSR